ncbi:hypothetical protein ACFSO7_02830 [Bacillus sp. CGMCC 1.16607]
MEAKKCFCEDCGMQYLIVWDDENFHEPEFCAGCGSDNDLKESE